MVRYVQNGLKMSVVFDRVTVQLVYQWFGYTLKRVWTNTRPQWCAHNFLIYADDLVIMAETEEQLQNLLNLVFNWCSTWRLKVIKLKLNTDKTNIVHFRLTRQQKTNFNFKYGEHIINIASEYKYLGIIVGEHLKFDSCTSALANAAGRALGTIISKFKELKNVGYHIYTKLYNSGVTPILEYSCAVWPCVKTNKIDVIQNRAMRYFLEVHKYAPNAGLSGDMEWIKHAYKRYLCAFRFWNQLLNMEDSKLTKHIFNWVYANQRGWCQDIKHLLIQLHLECVFSEKLCIDIDKVKIKLNDLMQEQWSNEMHDKPKLRTYVQIKDIFEPEPYVLSNISRQRRSLLAQIRLGILPIKTETGRFRSLPVEQRLC